MGEKEAAKYHPMPPALATATPKMPPRSAAQPLPPGALPREGELIPAGWELHKCKFQAKVFTVFKGKKKNQQLHPLPASPQDRLPSPSTLTQAAHPFPTPVHPPSALPAPTPVPPPGGG